VSCDDAGVAPCVPTRGQRVVLPGDDEPHMIDRVVVHARPASKGAGWEPGFRAVAMVEVELVPEPPDALQPALAGGWEDLKD
jgi:hypothetical protein